MFHSLLFPGFRRIIFGSFSACCLSISGNRLSAQTPAPATTAHRMHPQRQIRRRSLRQHPQRARMRKSLVAITPTTFKVHVNLVLVRVVVRDQQGKIVSNLKKENFQLYDNRKTTDNFFFWRGDIRDAPRPQR